MLGIVFGGLLAIATALLIQEAERPFSVAQWILLAGVSIPPGFGLAMVFDPYSRNKRAEYLERDFYQEEE
jgi:hypothetical protein